MLSLVSILLQCCLGCQLDIQVREWNEILPDTIGLKNAYKERKAKDGEEQLKVPQSFTFMAREGLLIIFDCHFYVLVLSPLTPFLYLFPGLPGCGLGLATAEKIPRRYRQDGNSKDIFALVKLSMSDTHLSQDPLLVFPEACLGYTEQFFNKVNSTKAIVQQELDEDRVGELQELAAAFKKDFPYMSRAIEYYDDLCNAQRRRAPYPHLDFIDSGRIQLTDWVMWN